ncbi:MAG: hypothetical protein J0H34_20835 [Rhizobiales bacterium]|nr:hypothetical protein [Hyphomicrobiales bacterium]
MILAALETKIAKLESDIARETAAIAAAIAAHQIGNGYWQRRHRLEAQLRAAIDLRDAIKEVQP